MTRMMPCRWTTIAGRSALLCAMMLWLGGCNDNTVSQSAPQDAFPPPPADAPGPAPEARVIALSREGDIASLDIDTPWTVKATASLGASINSVKCRAGACLVVHPDPVNALTLLDAQTLAVIRRFDLDKGSDPRDVVFTDDHSAVITLYNRDYLLGLDTLTGTTREISLSALADDDGLPESNMVAACGKQVYVQLQRLDHDSGLPSKRPSGLAIVDTWNHDALHHADLAMTPALDIRTDCATRELTVAEPKSIIQGGGTVERVSLKTGRVTSALTGDEFANGGILSVAPGRYWLNQHTDTGPGPSSHLSLVGAGSGDVYNVFATEHVDNFEFDPVSRWLFYPNPCATLHAPGCGNGVHVFNADSGVSAGNSIDPGFSPIEVAVSR